MRKLVLAAAMLFLVACAKQKAPARPLSEPGETIHLVKGAIAGRDAADNTLRVDHEAIPGYMDAMIMDYPVRGAAVASLPPDRSRVEAKLHVHEDRVWLTDVKRTP